MSNAIKYGRCFLDLGEIFVDDLLDKISLAPRKQKLETKVEVGTCDNEED